MTGQVSFFFIPRGGGRGEEGRQCGVVLFCSDQLPCPPRFALVRPPSLTGNSRRHELTPRVQIWVDAQREDCPEWGAGGDVRRTSTPPF